MRRIFAVLACIAVTRLSFDEVLSQEVTSNQSIAKGTLEFSTKLIQSIHKKAQQNDNVLFSPITVYLALALVHLGADSTTRSEIADLLGLPKADTNIQQTHEALSQLLKTIENTTEIKNVLFGPKKSTSINIANGIFAQSGINFIQSYASQVQSYYKGEILNVDFAKESNNAADIINQFVSKNTDGKIPKLYASPVPQDTSVLLAGSLYLKASWDNPFADLATNEEDFNTSSGNVRTELMSQTDTIPYQNFADLQFETIGLPIAGKDISIFPILPYSNQTLDNVVSTLDATTLQRIVKESKPRYVHYKIPKIKFQRSNDIKNLLEELGIKNLFGSDAKLNNMVSNSGSKVSQVAHATEIQFNEKGTQPNAAIVFKTLILFGDTRNEISFHINRPFAFFIYHHKTETILLFGVFRNPNSTSNTFTSK